MNSMRKSWLRRGIKKANTLDRLMRIQARLIRVCLSCLWCSSCLPWVLLYYIKPRVKWVYLFLSLVRSSLPWHFEANFENAWEGWVNLKCTLQKFCYPCSCGYIAKLLSRVSSIDMTLANRRMVLQEKKALFACVLYGMCFSFPPPRYKFH